jgi:large subunit ribosomal protein L33
MRVQITLECTKCNERNYSTTKNRRTHPERAEFKKYCPRCNRHTAHKETR